MNMYAYKADTALNRKIPCIFFKILIQLYLLCSFLYSLTYCIKEVINGKIFWRFTEKRLGYEAAIAWNRGIPCNSFKTLIQLVGNSCRGNSWVPNSCYDNSCKINSCADNSWKTNSCMPNSWVINSWACNSWLVNSWADNSWHQQLVEQQLSVQQLQCQQF